MTAQGTPKARICAICGQDCSNRKRVKDPKGRGSVRKMKPGRRRWRKGRSRLIEAKRIEAEREQQTRELLSRFAERTSEEQEPEEEEGMGVVAAFMTSMFGIIDALFFVLAVGTAYRIASGSGQE